MSLPDKKRADTTNTEFEEVGEKGKNEDCKCVDDKNEKRIEKNREKEKEFQIHFEDNLHNQVYVKR